MPAQTQASASSTQDVSIQPAITQTAPDYMNIVTPRSVQTQSEHGIQADMRD